MDVAGIVVPDDPLVIDHVLVHGKEISLVDTGGIFLHGNVFGRIGHEGLLVGGDWCVCRDLLYRESDFVGKVWSMDVALCVAR